MWVSNGVDMNRSNGIEYMLVALKIVSLEQLRVFSLTVHPIDKRNFRVVRKISTSNHLLVLAVNRTALPQSGHATKMPKSRV